VPVGAVVVAYSNAGLYAPAVAAAVDAAATVFVDAAAPSRTGSTALAPADFLRFLTTLTDADGTLPPWSQWWSADDLASLYPSVEWQRRVSADEQRLPLAYFSATVDVPDGWTERPCAYIAFGETYADETALARRHGWPVRVLTGRHLQLLHEPDAVADEIVAVTAQLGVARLGD
jgi:hypothetical protein